MKITFNGANINYTDCGKGNTLVLLHGFTETIKIWDYFSEYLSKKFRVICIDLPGHGESDCIDNIHSMELISDILKSLLDKLSIDKCVMIGHSMGGYVSLAFARKYGKLLSGLGLFHSSVYSDSEQAKEARMRAIEIVRNDHHAFLAGFIQDLFAPENKEIFKKEIDNLVKDAKQMSKEAIIAAQMGMIERHDSKDILVNAKYPVMFIAGHKDSRIPVKDIQSQLILPETSYSLLLKNAGHMGYLEEKEKTLHFIKAFTETCFP